MRFYANFNRLVCTKFWDERDLYLAWRASCKLHLLSWPKDDEYEGTVPVSPT